MKKEEINNLFREYAPNLSPTESDRTFVSKIYKSFADILINNCIQIGSYPRFTSIRPLHDLDILYIIGTWNELAHRPQKALSELYNKITTDYQNPTSYKIKVSLQTHSVTISFLTQDEEIFSIDIVPAYTFSQNEFSLDTYKVPEILRKKHGSKRQKYYERLASNGKEMGWITSDPRGYIQVASNINNINSDFRKSVKFSKAWARSFKEVYEDFKFKSFHIEQLITRQFKINPQLEIFDAVFQFFVELPDSIDHPQITDRADNQRFIDEYINELTAKQKQMLIQARDNFLSLLEGIEDDTTVEDLLKPILYDRKPSEYFLFDEGIPTLTDSVITIQGIIQSNGSDFRRLNAQGFVDNGYEIKFSLLRGVPCDDYRWKVKNDDNCKEPRGDITVGRTHNVPESTRYPGHHYVECYAILDGVCIAKARQNVVIKERGSHHRL